VQNVKIAIILSLRYYYNTLDIKLFAFDFYLKNFFK